MALPKGEAETRPQSWAQTAKGQPPNTEGHRGLAQSADKLEAGAGGPGWVAQGTAVLRQGNCGLGK